MKNNLLLIDGHNLLFRMFFGVPSRIYGKDNKPIHGIVGFIGGLLRAILLFKPTYVLVVFDCEKDSFRLEMDADYKGNRVRDWSNVAEEENPFSQLKGIYDTLDYLSIAYCEVEGIEADDVIAAYVRRYQSEANIIILSTDTDFLQLVDTNVTLFYPRGKKSVLYNPKEVKDRFGVSPERIAEFKALKGDSSDNIRGISGIGEKTAIKLIDKFNDINELYNRISEILPQKLQDKLRDGEGLLKKNLKLIRLNQEVELPKELTELNVVDTIGKYKTMQVLKEIGLI